MNCGIGSSSLNAEVNALERLQIVRGRNFFVTRLEVQLVDGAGKVSRSFQFALDERLLDHHLGRDIREFTFLPRSDLSARGFEIRLHAVDADRDAVD
jgi:hypothetical protein